MYEYEVIEFQRQFELDDEWDVVAASMSAQGTRESSTAASNRALIRRPVDDADTSEGVAEPTCGYETDSGPCGRTVEDPDEYCWQHEEPDE